MTIKELEQLTKMNRANIRYYESEGLINPKWDDNGYRDYSSEDLAVLERIKLLRALKVSIADIKAMNSGVVSLVTVLDQQIAILRTKKEEITKAQQVCQKMLEEKADYHSFEARKYYDEHHDRFDEALKDDKVPVVLSPIRRWFARSFDFAIYHLIIYAILVFVFNVNIGSQTLFARILGEFAVILLVYLIEPVLLCVIGTTPGKLILGLSVCDENGGHLSYLQARERTKVLIIKGLGLGIPVYGQYCSWRSYKLCSGGEVMEWDDTSVLRLKDDRMWRTAIFVIMWIILQLLPIAVSLAGGMPYHKNNLTVAEFAENFNRLSSYRNIDLGYDLDSYGRWVEKTNQLGSFQITDRPPGQPPDFSFELAEGSITSITFNYQLKNSRYIPDDLKDQMNLTVLAFVCAQDGFDSSSVEYGKIFSMIANNTYRDFHYRKDQITIDCNVEYYGYDREMLILGFSEQDIPEENYYSLTFTVSKK